MLLATKSQRERLVPCIAIAIGRVIDILFKYLHVLWCYVIMYMCAFYLAVHHPKVCSPSNCTVALCSISEIGVVE